MVDNNNNNNIRVLMLIYKNILNSPLQKAGKIVWNYHRPSSNNNNNNNNNNK